MKIKTVLIFMIVFRAGSNDLLAQKFYLGLEGGYGVGVNKSDGTNFKQDLSGIGYPSFRSNPYSYGKGIKAGLYFGYLRTKNIGFEIRFSYLKSDKYISESGYYFSPSLSTIERTEKVARMYNVIPSVRFVLPDHKWQPYMRIGFATGFAGKIIESDESVSSGTTNSKVETKRLYSGGISLGFQSALGVTFTQRNMFTLFAECVGNFQNWAVKKSVLTEYKVDGSDMLFSLDKRQREIEFVKTFEGSSVINTDLPTKAPQTFLPFSSIGINVGINFIFVKNKIQPKIYKSYN